MRGVAHYNRRMTWIRAVKSLVKAVASSLNVEIRRRPTEPPEPNAFGVQSRLIKRKDPVIFDVGAYDGEISRIYRQLFPQATIHAFEPFPDSFAAMDRKFLGDKRHHRHQIALSDRAGNATLHSNIGAPTNSLLPTHALGEQYWGDLVKTTATIKVQTERLDAFCSQSRVPRIDLLKLDTQGAELAVLRGAGTLFDPRYISAVFTEILLVPVYEGQANFDEFVSLFYSRGYRLVDVTALIRINRELMQIDALFA